MSWNTSSLYLWQRIQRGSWPRYRACIFYELVFFLGVDKASRIILKGAENLQDASCNLCVLSLTFKHILQQKVKLLKFQDHIMLMSQLIKWLSLFSMLVLIANNKMLFQLFRSTVAFHIQKILKFLEASCTIKRYYYANCPLRSSTNWEFDHSL